MVECVHDSLSGWLFDSLGACVCAFVIACVVGCVVVEAIVVCGWLIG